MNASWEMAKGAKPPTKGRKHTKIEHLEVFGLKAHFIPMGLLVYAENYLQAAKTAQPLSGSPQFQPARLFLAGRSLELALKAFLSLKGVAFDRMAEGALGHNLDRLLRDAKAEGLGALVKLTPEQEAEIIRASTYYAEKVYEYPALVEAVHGYRYLAELAPLIKASEALIEALRQPCSEA
jgi:hypothetical protein